VAFSPDDKFLATGGDDQRVRLWDTTTGEEVPVTLRHTARVRALAWSPDGKRLAAASDRLTGEGAVKLWEMPAGRPLPGLPGKAKVGRPFLALVRCLAFSPDGKRLAAGGGPVWLWDLEKGGEPLVLDWQVTIPSYVYALAFAPDGKTLAFGCHHFTGDDVRVCALAEPGTPTFTLQGTDNKVALGHSDVRAALAYSPDGKLLMRVSRDGPQTPTGSLMLWNVSDRAPKLARRNRLAVPGGAVFALAATEDGPRLAVAEGPPDLGVAPKEPGKVQLWDQASGRAKAFDSGHREMILSLAFSADGRLLATGSADQTVRLWEVSP
jgi:WD40 repeat protein